MKNLLALALAGTLLLAGCAGKKAVEDPVVQEEAPPAVAVQEPPAPAIEEAPAVEPPPAPVQEVAVEKGADKIFFDFDSYLLTPAGIIALEENAKWLKDETDVLLVIEGHADERGSDTYNLALGDKRSQAVRDYLVKRGVAPERMGTVSYGEEKATRGAETEADWARDRRADLVRTN
jgi:peptidoglycan-associated lipoprotein